MKNNEELNERKKLTEEELEKVSGGGAVVTKSGRPCPNCGGPLYRHTYPDRTEFVCINCTYHEY